MSKLIYCQSLAAIALCFGLQGCGKQSENTTFVPPPPMSQTPTSATSAQTLAEAAKERHAAQAPKADGSVPFESYRPLEGGKPILFAYYALSGIPVDYQKIAEAISDTYRGSSDEFKKRDTLAALKPGIEKAIAEAKNNRYFTMLASGGVDAYDFSTKSFPHRTFGREGLYYSFDDAYGYSLVFSNSSAFKKIYVADETTAREIERRRSAHENINTRIYFFISDVELGTTKVRAEITRIELLDQRDNILFRQ